MRAGRRAPLPPRLHLRRIGARLNDRRGVVLGPGLHGPLNRTTPLNLLMVAACALAGALLYARGYTYEGSVLVYMIGGIVFAAPYYSARYTWWMTSLVFSAVVPTTIWLQNKAVEVGLW